MHLYQRQRFYRPGLQRITATIVAGELAEIECAEVRDRVTHCVSVLIKSDGLFFKFVR